MAGCVQHFDRHIAHLDLLTVARSSRATRRRGLVQHVLRADLLRKLAASRNVIGVHVCVEHVPNRHSCLAGCLKVRLNVLDGIDNGTHRVTAATEQIRRADRIPVEELPEDHVRAPETLTPITPNFWAVFSFVVPLKHSYWC